MLIQENFDDTIDMLVGQIDEPRFTSDTEETNSVVAVSYGVSYG